MDRTKLLREMPISLLWEGIRNGSLQVEDLDEWIDERVMLERNDSYARGYEDGYADSTYYSDNAPRE